jgi:alkylhydroperoxidase/carboxymuconolactone decarboxylase family protein YurZ
MEFMDKTSHALDKFRDAIYAEGALDKKTKFLIALSNCVALGCEPCMIHRLKAAKEEFDCTETEIEDAVSIAILNAAGTTQAKFMAAWRKSNGHQTD